MTLGVISGISYQMTSGVGNARSLGEILYDFCPACTSITDPCLGLMRINGRSEIEETRVHFCIRLRKQMEKFHNCCDTYPPLSTVIQCVKKDKLMKHKGKFFRMKLSHK